MGSGVKYRDEGFGKCVTMSGGDPQHKYIAGSDKRDCETKCSEDFGCFGYSASAENNCILWKEEVKKGPNMWTGARCVVKEVTPWANRCVDPSYRERDPSTYT